MDYQVVALRLMALALVLFMVPGLIGRL